VRIKNIPKFFSHSTSIAGRKGHPLCKGHKQEKRSGDPLCHVSHSQKTKSRSYAKRPLIQAVDELSAELSSAAAQASSQESLVAALGRSYVTFAEEKSGEFNLAFRTEEHRGKMPNSVREGLKKALRPLHDAVSATVKEARSPEEVDRIVAGIWSGWHGYALLKQAGCVVDQTPIFDAKTAAATFGSDRSGAEAAAH